MEQPNLEDLLPHKKPMILLDRVGEISSDGLYCFVDINPNSKFFESDGVPSYIGLEYMAQTVAAYAGYRALLNKGSVKEGFLLGSREVEFKKPKYLIGESLKISCIEFMHNEEMGVFDCKIENTLDNEIYSCCKLNVFQPDNPSSFFEKND